MCSLKKYFTSWVVNIYVSSCNCFIHIGLLNGYFKCVYIPILDLIVKYHLQLNLI